MASIVNKITMEIDKNNNSKLQRKPDKLVRNNNLVQVKEANSSLDPEIERSLYYLGRALYRFSLLQQERREK